MANKNGDELGALETSLNRANEAGVIHPELLDELRDHARKMDAHYREHGANEDRALLAGVVDGVAPPDPEPEQIGDDPESALNHGIQKPLPPIERTPWFMSALTGLPREEVEKYLETHPDPRPPLHAPLENKDPPTLWQPPVRAVFVGRDFFLAGTGDFREHLAGTMVKLKHGDRVMYWGDFTRTGVYLVREGAWEPAGDPIVQYAAWAVNYDPTGESLPTFISIEDVSACELRITGEHRAQVSPLLTRVGYVPVQGTMGPA